MNVEDRKDYFVIVRVTKAVKEKLWALAQKEGIVLSKLIRRIIKEYCG